MTLIREFMLVLFLTTISGSLLMLIWMAVVHVGMRRKNVYYAYWMLRGILAGYLVPLVYLLIYRCIEFAKNDFDTLAFSNENMDKVFLILFTIWIVGVCLHLLSQLHTWICFQRIKKSSMVVKKEYLQVLQKLCTEMKLRKTVSLYQGYGVRSPFIIGVRNPRIYLPMQPFAKEELEIVLYHELVHYQQGDTFWKPLFGVMGNLYWFNPLSRLLWKEAIRWTEANCDSYCCRERFQAKKYFSLLLKMGSADQSRLNGYAPMWTEGSRELKWRIQCMKKNLVKKPRGGVIVAIITASLIGSGLSAHAATKRINGLYNEVYWDTAESTEEPLDQELEENEFEGTEAEFEGTEIVDHPEEETLPEARTTMKTFAWPMLSNSTHRTAGFTAKAGGKINVLIAVNRDDKLVKMGIIKPDGTTSYVRGKGGLSHTFTVSTTGTYKVFVQNLSATKLQVQGSYTY